MVTPVTVLKVGAFWCIQGEVADQNISMTTPTIMMSYIKYTTSRSTDFVHDWALVVKPLNYDTEYLFVQVLCRVYNLSPVCWITSCIQQNISLSYKKYALFTRENKEDFS